MKKVLLCIIMTTSVLLSSVSVFGADARYAINFAPFTHEVTNSVVNINGSLYINTYDLNSIINCVVTDNENFILFDYKYKNETVKYYKSEGKIEIYNKDTNKTDVKTNFKKIEYYNDKYYVPLRDFFEALDYSVGFKNENGVNYIPITVGKTVSSYKDKYSTFFAKTINSISNSENQVVSPYGIMTVMGLMAEGSNGETRNEILKAVGSDNIVDFREYMKNYNDFQIKMSNSKYGTINVFNSVVLNSAFNRNIKNEYKENIENCYNGNVLTIDSPESFDKILSEKTNGTILKSGFDKDFENFDTSFTSTVYIDFDWTEKFDVNSTEKGVFNNFDGTKSDVMFMNKLLTTSQYYKDNNVEAVVLDYVEDANKGDYKMAIVTSTDNITADDIKNINNNSNDRYVKLKMPKFRIDNTVDLEESLKNMGVNTIFTDSADFSSMTDESINISSLTQHNIIDVNEEGTTASSFTEATYYRDVPENIVEVNVDKPFTYYIFEKTSGQIIFAGKYNKGVN